MWQIAVQVIYVMCMLAVQYSMVHVYYAMCMLAVPVQYIMNMHITLLLLCVRWFSVTVQYGMVWYMYVLTVQYSVHVCGTTWYILVS